MGRDLPFAFSPSGASPSPTTPLFLRSICQLDVSPELFLSVNAKMALPFLTASLRSASSEVRDEWMASKAAEEGKESILKNSLQCKSSR